MGNEKEIRVRQGWSGSFSVLVDCTEPMLDMPLIDISTSRLSEYRVRVTCCADISEALDRGRVDLEFAATFYSPSDFEFEFDQRSHSLDPENIPSGGVTTGVLPVQVVGVGAKASHPCTIRRDQMLLNSGLLEHQMLLNSGLLEHGGLLQAFDSDGLPKPELPLLIDPVWGSGVTITRVTKINGQPLAGLL